MQLHNFVPNLFLGAVLLDGLISVTSAQEFRCNKCGETVSLPDCGKTTCLHLLRHGCSGKMEKGVWKSPIKSKAIYEEKIDYPAKKNGNVAKKRTKGARP